MPPRSERANYQYPAPKLIQLRDVWVVKVSIPAHMRHLFGNGSGTTRDRRKSTKTKDYKLAKSREHELVQVIYDEFDEKLQMRSQQDDELTDKFAVEAINGLALSFKHRDIPELIPKTDYISLESFKNCCDVYSDLVFNNLDNAKMRELFELIVSNPHLEDIIIKSRAVFGGANNKEQVVLSGRYKTEFVHTFWQDLLLSAAREQGLTEPVISKFKGSTLPFAVFEDTIFPNIPLLSNLANKISNQPLKPISRPARVIPQEVLTISSVMQGYLEDMRLKQENVGTQRKLTRFIEQFIAVMGDLEIDEIRPKHGYDYVRAILKDYPTRSNGTLKDYNWGVQNFLKYCVENGWIDTNPFIGLDLSKYGEATEETYPFSREDLQTIFSYDWELQERLFLSILATTGMRPSEAGNLTWERFNDTEYDGVRFFTLLNTGEERVQVKNQSSRREVPLHPDLWLPSKGTGRLFEYKKNDEGLSSTDASHTINPIIGKLVPHPNKSIRSFRRTFKTLLRDLSVGEEVHDAITGHTIPSASRKNYGGMGMRVKFDAIAKLDISFL